MIENRIKKHEKRGLKVLIPIIDGTSRGHLLGSEAHWDSITQGLKDTVLINYNNRRAKNTSDLTRHLAKGQANLES